MGGHCYSHEHLPIVNDTLDCLNFFEFGQLPILLIAEALLGSRVQLGEQVGGGLVVGLGLGGPLLLLLLALLLQDVVVAPLDKLLVDGLEGRVEVSHPNIVALYPLPHPASPPSRTPSTST